MASKVENKKLTVQILHERLLNQDNGSVLLETIEMLVCGDITATTSCTKLTRRHAVDRIGTRLCGSILHGNSYYTVVASILVPSAASC